MVAGGETGDGSEMENGHPAVGVLGLQGDVEMHLRALREAGASARRVRTPAELDAVEALVIPGGESTTIGLLLERFGLMEPLRRRVAGGLPVFGTCAGLILLADEIEGSRQPRIGGFHLAVQRNAYGRQVESFETDLTIPILGDEPVRGVFIRAPRVTRTAPDVEVLAGSDAGPVLVRQGRLLGATFHPELTPDRRVHRLFLSTIDS